LEGRFVIGFLGSFYYYEGLDILLKAFRTVIERSPDSLLLLVGDGKTRTSMESLARRLGLVQEQIRFIGNVPHKEVPEYYSVMDLLVYPRKSIRLTELVTPLKPLEAMCMGKAVAGSRIGGIEELVQDGKTGVLFPPDDPESLARTILDLMKDPDRRKRIGEEARRAVCESRNWKKITERYPAIYENAIRSHSA
jgi:glycosyltransferase involved in cell wall biosynthesis